MNLGPVVGEVAFRYFFSVSGVNPNHRLASEDVSKRSSAGGRRYVDEKLDCGISMICPFWNVN
jgi:hypothetical protein